MKPEIIIALDFPTGGEALSFVEGFQEHIYVKVGMELFYSEGPEIVKSLKSLGHRVFLDLKLHDIPNTVGSAMDVLGRLGVDMTNVHAAGGISMMRAARAGLERGAAAAGRDKAPLLIAVTQLTSTDCKMMNEELLIPGYMQDVVIRYAANADSAGLDGVVCSAWEAGVIHDKVHDNFITVTPGIRLAGDSQGDQSRVATPGKAAELGSDYLVVGRSITRADDPVAAYHRCLSELEEFE